MDHPARVRVVSAVIIRGDRILLTQRRPDKDFAFTWECPGGKVNPAENLRLALRRELHEELGVWIQDIHEFPVWVGDFVAPIARPIGTEIRLSFHVVELAGTSRPVPREGQGIGWFTEREMRGLVLTPANAAALEEIALRLRRSE